MYTYIPTHIYMFVCVWNKLDNSVAVSIKLGFQSFILKASSESLTVCSIRTIFSKCIWIIFLFKIYMLLYWAYVYIFTAFCTCERREKWDLKWVILSTAVDPPVMGKLHDLTYNSIHKLFLKFSCYYIAPFKFFDDENHFQFLTVFDDFTLIFIFLVFFFILACSFFWSLEIKFWLHRTKILING